MLYFFKELILLKLILIKRQLILLQTQPTVFQIYEERADRLFIEICTSGGREGICMSRVCVRGRLRISWQKHVQSVLHQGVAR